MVGSWLSPAAQPSVPTETSVVERAPRSRTKTSFWLFGSRALSFDEEANTTLVPLSSIHGSKPPVADWLSLSWRLTRVVAPSVRSRTKASTEALVSPATRLVALDSKATYRPFDDIDGR